MLNGPDIRNLMKNESFDNVLNANEKKAWRSVKEVIEGFLGKHRSMEYQRSVLEILDAFEKIKSLKIHFLHHHLDYFEAQLPTESDEQGERFHQTALPFEMR